MPPPVQSPETTWREVTARVHVSLSPQDLATRGKAAATHNAFRTLLMRYSTPLRGVPVAHRGGLEFKSPAVFVGASPYAHIVATARLLVFSPPRGTVFVGVVKHVGPDHVGLSVLHAFHAVLPLEPLRHVYAYDYHFGEDGLIRRWRCVNETSPFNQHVTLGRHIRFVVEGIKPSHTGLFQIHASLNDDIRRETHRPDEPLGVQHPDAQLSIPADDSLDIHNQPTSANADLLPSGETPPAETVDVFAASRRSSGSRARASAILEDDPFSSNVFGDALSQSPFGTALPPVSTPSPKTGRKKKQKHTSSQRHRSKTVSPKVEARSVKFEQVQVALGHDEANGATVASAEASQAEASQAEASQAEASHAEASHAEASHAEASQAEASQAEASQAEASQVGVLTQADVVSQTDVAAQTPSQSSQKRKETKEERRKRREEKRLRKQAKNKAAMEAALFAQIGTQVDRPGKAENREIGSDAAAHTGQGGSGSPIASGPPASRMAQMRADALRAVAVGQLAESKLATETKVKEDAVVEEIFATVVGSQESSGSRKGKKHRKRKRETAVATFGAEGGTAKKRKKRHKMKREPAH